MDEREGESSTLPEALPLLSTLEWGEVDPGSDDTGDFPGLLLMMRGRRLRQPVVFVRVKH